VKTWSTRPTELAYLFNPAYCGWVLREAIEGYSSVKPDGMPLPMAYLVLPVVLHRATRDLLPRGVATTLHGWLQVHPELRINFADRTKELAQFTREAVLFLGVRGQLRVGEGGAVTVAGKLGGGKAALLENSEEIVESLSKAKFVGRWFASAGEPTTVFQMWGVCP
jgi:hypothetical protein